MKKIYVGNLPFTATEEEVRELFSDYSSISSINLITDRDTGRFRGFGFLELEDDDAAAAIKDLNDKDFGGRPLKVNEARERQERPRSRSW